MNHRTQKNPLGCGCYLSLACSIGSISIACGSLLQMNSASDRISLQRGLFLTSLGFVHFISLTDFFNKYFIETRQGVQFRRKYRLMVSDVMDITNKIVSAIQAAFSCIAGFIVCKSSCTKSFLYASHFVMEAYAWFGTAYFMYDIWSMYKVHTHKIAEKLKLVNLSNNLRKPPVHLANGGLYDKHTMVFHKGGGFSPDGVFHSKHHEDEMDYGENVELPKDGRWDFIKYILTHPIMIMHHIFIGTFGLLVVTYLRGGFGDCVYSFIYLMEFSTPFVSVRSVLSTMGLKNSRMYIFNGLVMLGTFFICRIVMWPYVLYWYSEAINRPFVQAILGLPRGCKISILILFLPQIYWFSLMCKGAIKVFFVPKKIPHKSKNNNLSPVDGSSYPSIKNGLPQGFDNTSSSESSPADEKQTDGSIKVMQGRSLL